MTRAALTGREGRVLEAIRSAIARDGVAPSRVELMQALGFKSRSSAQALVDRLVLKGWLERRSFRARGLALSAEAPTRQGAGAPAFGVTLAVETFRALFIPAPFGTFLAEGFAQEITVTKRTANAGANADQRPAQTGRLQARHTADESQEPTGELRMPGP